MQKKKYNEKFASHLILAMTGVVCAIALVLAGVIISTSQHAKRNAKAIYEHPYTVTSEAREMRSRLLDMKQFVVIFITDPSNTKFELQQLFATRYAMQDEAIEMIGEHYTGAEKDVKDLSYAMDALKWAQSVAMDVIYGDGIDGTGNDGIDDDKVSEYLQEYVYPYYDAVNDALSPIIAFSDNKLHELEQEIVSTTTISLVAAIVFPLIIIAFAVYTVHLERKRHRKDVAYREKLFDMLSTTVDDVFLILDVATLKAEYVSPNCRRALGIEAEDFVSLDKLYERLDAEDVSKIATLFNDGVLQTQAERELRYRITENKTRWLAFKIYPVRIDDRIERYVVSISDQTESMSVQQTLKEALAVAQNANNAKKDFLSRMSHEIRTPMNAIIGMTTIAATYLDDKARVEDCLGKISFSSRHLLSLINDILDMSKIEDNKLIVNHEQFEFKQLVESVTAIIYSQSNTKGVEFHERLIDCNEEILIGDSMRVNQILLNLLSNAVKFTPAGGRVSLDIRQLPVSGSQVYLRFTVSDTGIGMSEEFLQRIYLPFEQADASTSQKYGGTGLGMPITKNLIVLLGGTIDVRSEIGNGTIFTVELPFELPAEKAAKHKLKMQALNVLVVDDDRDTCVHAELLLKKMNIVSQWVLSGTEAVRVVVDAHNEGSDFDVCIIDWQMPEMDGIETTRRIRKAIGPDTPIIIISAYDIGVIETAAREAGANAFIPKPMFASTLYNTLLSVTGHNAADAEPSKRRETFDFRGRRILLAEDNALNMEIAVELLKMTGAEIDGAVNGKIAADMFFDSEPEYYDLILMDIQMPVMNGYEATRLIRSSDKADAAAVPIFAMTANAFNEDVAAARENGMNGHIAKPIDVDQLYRLLKSVFQGRK